MDIILALETTEKYGSVALLDGRTLLEEVILPRDKRSAQSLTSTVDAILRKHAVEPKDVAVVAVVIGPGSFTGLRVGVTAAKMFAWATGAEIVWARTDSVVAEGFLLSQMPGLLAGETDRPFHILPQNELPPYLSVGVDAQRGEVCASVFKLESVGRHMQYRGLTGSELIPVSDWWKQAERWENLCFSGPALERYAIKAPKTIRLADESLWMPRASVLGNEAAQHLEHQVFTEDYLSLVPFYSRLSAAEERRSAIDG